MILSAASQTKFPLIKKAFFTSLLKAGCGVVLSSLLFLGSVAHANLETRVLSLFDGSYPYMVVTQDLVGLSQREPGIYVPEGDAWKLLIKGKVLTGGGREGIIAQFPQTKQDQRHASLAIVDGQIVLLQSLHNQVDEKSVLILGQADAIPKDVYFNEVHLPPIQNLDDVSVFFTEPEARRQALFLSIKMPNATHGDGVILGMMVDELSKENPSQLNLTTFPIVLDYKYLSDTELFKVSFSGSQSRYWGMSASQFSNRAFSQLINRQVIRRHKGGELYINLKNWLDKLTKAEASLYAEGGKALIDVLPYVDLVTGAVELSKQVEGVVNLGLSNASMVQKYDPLEGRDQLVLGSDSFFNGRLNVDSTGNYRIATDPYIDGIQLAYFNSELYFISAVAGVLSSPFQIAPRQDKLPSRLSFVARQTVEGDFRDYYLLISTFHSDDDKGTRLVRLRRSKDGVISLVAKYGLDSEFHTNHVLRERCSFPGYEANHTKEILFDTMTPPIGTLQGYTQARVATKPFLNLTKSLATTKEFSYVEALRETIIPKVGVYYKYDTADLVAEDQSALQVEGMEKGAGIEVRGELLERTEGPGLEDPRVFSRDVKLGEAGTPAVISIIPMDKNFKGGRAGFHLVVTITPGTGSNFKPFSTSYPFEYPFSEFDGAQLLTTRKKGINYLLLTAAMKPSKAPARPTYASRSRAEGSNGIRVIRWIIDRPEAKKDDKSLYSFELSERKNFGWPSVAGTPLSQRVKMDEEGTVYWVIEPEKNPSDAQYQLHDLVSDRKLYPNSDEGKKVKFLTETEMLAKMVEGVQGEAKELLGVGSNRWRIFNWYDVIQTFKSLEKSTEPKSPDPQRADRGKKAGKEDIQKAFEQFPNLRSDIERDFKEDLAPIHRVYLVSDDDYPVFVKALSAVLFTGGKEDGNVNYENESLLFNGILEDVKSQKEILNSLGAMRSVSEGSRKRSFLVGSVESILRVGTPQGDDNGVKWEALSDTDQKPPFLPHLMYLLATEGRRLDLKDFKTETALRHEIPMILVGSVSKWAELKAFQGGVLEQQGVFGKFQVSKRFLNGSWKLWPPTSGKATEEVKKAASQPLTDVEKKIFPGLGKVLEQIADPKLPMRHRVLLVSKDVKQLTKRMILSRWATVRQGPDSVDSWSYMNPELELYRISDQERPNQDVVAQNFKALIGDGEGRRGVIFGDLEQVRSITRPPEGKLVSFSISDIVGPVSGGAVSGDQGSERGEGMLPHLLYLFEAEGKALQPAELMAARGNPKQTSILLVGTRTEWDEVKRGLDFEARFDVAGQFEVSELESPDRDARTALLIEVAEQPEVRRLGYRYDVSELGIQETLSREEAEKKLLGYLVNRAESLARQSEIGQDVMSAYIKVLTAFRQNLTEDPDLRNSKVIDLPYLERLLSRVFGIALNLRVLPPNDPYRILSDSRAAMKLQDLGYRGPIEIKNQVFRTLLAPTRTDPTQVMPGSIVIFGSSSTGKTFLFRKTMELLGLKEYQMTNPHDADVGYFMVNVGKIVADSKNASGDKVALADVMKHLNNFLALPKGFRGHILLDDIHQGETEVTKTLIQFVRSLFEAERGMRRVEKITGSDRYKESVEIPVRNIHLWLTLNPTDNRQKIDEYSSVKGSPTDAERVVATLSTKEYAIEKSLLMRFGLFLNLSKFPLDAKAPTLSEQVQKSSKGGFEGGGLVVVTPKAIQKVVQAFPDSNAREFLSATINPLLRPAEFSEKDDTLFVVVPSQEERRAYFADFAGTGRDNAKIETYVRESTNVLSYKESMGGKLQFLTVIVDAVRNIVYESFVNAATQDANFAGAPELVEGRLTPLLHGVTHTVVTKSTLPWSVLNLDPRYFVQANNERPKLLQIIKDSGPDSATFFDLSLQGFQDLKASDTSVFSTMNDRGERSRSKVVLETIQKVNRIAKLYLQLLLRLPPENGLDAYPQPKDWLIQLGGDAASGEVEKRMEAHVLELGKKLADGYLLFAKEITDDRLYENRSDNQDQFYALNPYDIARLYTMIIDRALSSLPWGEASYHYASYLTAGVRDKELGQRPGVLDALFTSKFSLIRPATNDMILQISTYSQAYKDWDDEKCRRLEKNYSSQCSRAFWGLNPKAVK